MGKDELETTIAILSAVLAAVVLPPAAAVPVLTFLVGLLVGWGKGPLRKG